MPLENKADGRWLALLILCAGFLMIVLDMTIVNVALPSIKIDLGFSQAGLAWVVNAYLIAYAGLLLLAGRLGDLIGRKRIFLIGLVMFTAASVLCGLSISQPMLIAARFLQGIGGAVSSAVILGMVVMMFPEPAERARAIGVFSFVASAGASIGLLAGGIITQAVSWHWIFFVNLPIGVVIAVLAARLLASDRGLGLDEGADILGALLVTAGLMLGVYAIVQSADYGLVSTHTLGFGAVAVILLAAFAIRQAKGRNPLLPLRLFLVPNVSVANVIQALGGVAMFGFFFFSSLYMQRVLGYGPLTIGLAFLPVAVLMGTLSIAVTDRLIMRFGARKVLLVGFALISVALLLAARGPVSGDYLRDWFPVMALLGIGGGLAFPSLAVVAMAGASPSDAGLASGLLNTTGQVGAALGLAVLATVSTNRSSALMAQGHGLVAALSEGYHLAWAVGAGLAIASIVIAATLLKSNTTGNGDGAIEEEEEEASA
ncbi:MAG: DHA2 family efflux MFS transporter permease subunit [Candidatus Dormibacteraeota bacterium]|nr:DHA2 family efflux MFS transporter permease subunit [Candidatus Dormibacteraeota bacterium]